MFGSISGAVGSVEAQRKKEKTKKEKTKNGWSRVFFSNQNKSIFFLRGVCRFPNGVNGRGVAAGRGVVRCDRTHVR